MFDPATFFGTIVWGAVCVGGAWAVLRAKRASAQRDRRRSMERNLRRAADDADLQQEIARKLLREREG